jgi:LCP family protein required for cell wall assembly
MPRTRVGVLWRFLLAGVVVIACAAGTTAVAGLLEVKNIVNELKLGKPLKHVRELTLPPPGSPQTLLLVGADHRIGEGTGIGNTDTMMLARINDDSATINLLSIPRDLEVNTPDGGITKINAIYSESGPSGLLSVLKSQVFPGLKVNHILIVSFLGFARMIDAIGCVYTIVDHRYYNNTAVTDYSSINIEPGYQRLCGDNAGPTGALAFVRFRHTDSDLVREARQQDFIRWAKEGFSTAGLLSGKAHLIKVFAHNVQTDQNLDSTDGLINLADLAINANGHTLKSFEFPVDSTPLIDGDSFIQSDRTREEEVYKAFMTPTKNPPPALPAKPSRQPARGGKHKGAHKHHSAPISTAGLIADPGDGRSQAGQLGKIAMPVYYPDDIVSGPYAGYCFTLTANCDTPPNPSSVYQNSYPRKYVIRAPDGTKYPAYTMTLVINPVLGEYYSVQGTTWKTPPILTHAPVARVQVVRGRPLYVYENGGKVSVVAMHTRHGVYWIANTLEDTIPNSQMVAMAASLTLER